MRVRIEDVAREAGVSMKTVSRVVNNEANVREDTRKRVQAAIDQLDYRPSAFARGLAGHRSHLIAFLYDNPSSNFLMEVELGILDACESHREGMMLVPLGYSGNETMAKLNATVSHLSPDGFVLPPPLGDDRQLLARLAELGLPHACISPRHPRGRIGVTLDEVAAAREVVAHLLALGHRRIAHVLGKRGHAAREWRLKGYRDGLKAAGIEFDPQLVIEGAFDYPSGFAAARQLWALRHRPSAIFAANDECAAGVLGFAHQQRIDVPGALSICGFDDVPLAQQVYPHLTTVHQPTRVMGRLASLELLKHLLNPEQGTMVKVPLDLVPRDSTGPAP
ncbi:MAG: LacI family DNA-binding transcriptional regulator [Pseudomarimonas sp.]